MTFRIIGAFSALLLLSACGSIGSAVNYVWGDDQSDAKSFPADAVADAAVEPVQPATSVTTDNAWCTQIAGNERQKAQIDGFDLATQQRVTVTTFKQCMVMAGH